MYLQNKLRVIRNKVIEIKFFENIMTTKRLLRFIDVVR